MSSRLAEDVLSIKDPQETVDRIKRFLAEHYGRIGAKCLVVGMSGGLDSSLTAALCSKAVGGKQVLGLFLPEDETRTKSNFTQAKLVAKQFDVRFKQIDITSMIKTAKEKLSQVKKGTGTIPDANLKARLRMTTLYYFANAYNGLVVGTSDKSEMMLGYFTKYGDGACDLEPIADIYKTSLRFLGKYLRLPKIILSKPPSPELWPGQTAERELGASYQKLDLILWGLERWMSIREIADELNMPFKFVEKIRRRWIAAEHKRRPPMTMKMGFRTAGQDLRIPYSL
jgi:NAD+ synthase